MPVGQQLNQTTIGQCAMVDIHEMADDGLGQSQPAHVAPDPRAGEEIEFLTKNTKYDEKEILEWHW